MDLGHILFLLALLVPLTMDTCIVSATLGIAGLQKKEQLRTSVIFTAFEAGMPAVGVLIGHGLGSFLGNFAGYVAAAVIGLAGVVMLKPAKDDEKEEQQVKLLSRTRGAAIIGLGLAISLDEVAIGLSLGLLGVPLILAVIFIGIQAFIASQVGLKLGTKLSKKTREGTETFAGIALIVMALILVGLKIFGHQI